MNILIFGVQGSGKSTIGKYIAQKLVIPFIATGDIFRELREEKSPLGELVKNKIDSGEFVPDVPTMETVEKRLNKADAASGFVLDGAPRNLAQVRMLKKVDLIVLVDLSKEEAIKRLLARARHDDTKDSIEKRIGLYDEQTRPVIDYYRDKNVRIIKVDNTPAEDVVRQNLNGLLKEFKRN